MRAPGLGQHTEDIAAGWLGLAAEEITELIESGVLETDSPYGA
jgi:crotonobetainyl-CoA:carnitine CoA-transferase CaiB-like acyl-CoA transferase